MTTAGGPAARRIIVNALLAVLEGDRAPAEAITYAEVAVARGHQPADHPRRLARNACAHTWQEMSTSKERDRFGLWPGCVAGMPVERLTAVLHTARGVFERQTTLL